MPCHQPLITNPQITLKRDKNGKTYFLILDKDANQVYYAFPYLMKSGQHELETSWPVAQTVWIKFEGNGRSKRVVEFKVLKKKKRVNSAYFKTKI